ncbi:MAG: hypothetical protein ACRDJ0_01440, partial [Actinomycetota bacterium]
MSQRFPGRMSSGPVRRMTRREMLQRLGAGAAMAAFLAACGIEGESVDTESDENAGFTTDK